MRCCAGASVVDALSVRCDRFSVQTTKRMQSRLVHESNRVELASCSGPRSRGRFVHDALALKQRAAIEPVANERVGQTQAARGAIGCIVASAMRGEQIIAFEFEPLQPFALLRSAERFTGGLGELQKVRKMALRNDHAVFESEENRNSKRMRSKQFR